MDDLEDLFVEPGPLLHMPLSSALLSSLNERSRVGCCQRVTWAKTGVIAYCTPDAQDVVLQHLLCDPDDGQWKLSKQYKVEGATTAHNSTKWAHLCWDPSGHHLALSDTSGRISIYNVAISMNRIMASRRCVVDSEDDLGAVVGLTWLQSERSPTYHSQPAVLKDGQWSMAVTPQNAHGPKPPGSKPALLIATKASTVKVICQDRDNRWHQIRNEQERTKSIAGLLSHAAFCVDKGNGSDSMFLATFDADSQLRIFRLQIDFERSSINLCHVSLVACAIPVLNALSGVAVSMPMSSSQYRLVHLDFVPEGPELRSKTRPPAFVLAAFSTVTHDLHGANAVSTVISTWNLTSRQSSLHSSLSSLTPTKAKDKNAAPNAEQYRLTRSSSFFIDKALLTVQHVNISTSLVFAWHDGVIETRDSQSLEILPADSNGQISGLSQIGFAFPSDRLCIQTALSPNVCAAFSFDLTNFPNVFYLQYLDSHATGGPLDGATLATVNEAFGVHLSIAARSLGQNADDILATIQLFSRDFLVPQIHLDFMPPLMNAFNFNRTLISTIYRHLGIKMDSSMEEQPEQVIRNPIFQRCLGFHSAFGFQGRLNGRPIEGTIGLMILQLRNILLMWNYAASAKSKNGTETEIKRPETIIVLLPSICWALNLFCFILDEIISMQRFFEDSGLAKHDIDVHQINAHIHQTQSPALLMLYSSPFRALLKFCIRYLKGFALEGEKHHISTALGRSFQEFDRTMQKPPIRMAQFDKLLTQIDASLKRIYQETNISEVDRRIAEEQILIRAEIPQVVVPSVTDLLFELLPPLQKEIDEADLYFQDISRLGLTNDINTRMQNQFQPIDAMTKGPLRKNGKVRRCTRCCSLMDENPLQRNATVTAFFAGRCFCGSYWMVLDGDDLAQMQL